jgi:hypothetical protein
VALSEGVFKLGFLCYDGSVVGFSAGFDQLLAEFLSFLAGGFLHFLIVRHCGLALDDKRGERGSKGCHLVGLMHETSDFFATAGNAVSFPDE